jgi:hypothetical protein
VPKVPRSSLSVLGLVVLATTVAGCGGGGGDKALSSGEYAAAVTRLCTSNATVVQRLVVTSGGNLPALKADKIVDTATENIAKLKSLRPPGELEHKAGRLIVSAEAARDRLRVVVAAARKHSGNIDLGNTALIEAHRRVVASASAVGATC